MPDPMLDEEMRAVLTGDHAGLGGIRRRIRGRQESIDVVSIRA